MKLDDVKRCILLVNVLIGCVLSCNRSTAKNKIHGSSSRRLFDDRVIKGYVNSNVINEISGLAQSRRHKDVLYVLNDSGGMPRIFALNATTASMIAILNIKGALNCDWEDIAVGPGPYGNTYIYIGDVGGNTKSTCNTIYRVREPLVIKDSDLEIHGELKYTWNEPNCETLMVDQKGTIYLVSKVKPGNTAKLYSVPNFAWRFKKMNLRSGTNVNIKLDSQGPVAGDISLSGSEILIKTYEVIYYWKRHKSSDLAEVLQKAPTILPYITEAQGEAIGWAWRDRGYFTLSEGPNQPLSYYSRASGNKPATNMQVPKFSVPEVKGYIDRAILNEISGVAQSRLHKNVLYVLNDSGGKPRIFAIDSNTAQVLAILNITGAENCDWEDIAVGPGPEGHTYIYIGDIGGNAPHTCNRIYRVAEPQQIEGDGELGIHGEFTYSWEEGNCETLMVDQNGIVYLVSKIDPGYTPKLYEVPMEAWALKKITLRSGSAIHIDLESQGPVAGDISFSGKEILIKTYNLIYYWNRDISTSLKETLQQKPIDLPYIAERQGESICWGWRDEGYFTVSKGNSQPLYHYKRTNATNT